MFSASKRAEKYASIYEIIELGREFKITPRINSEKRLTKMQLTGLDKQAHKTPLEKSLNSK